MIVDYIACKNISLQHFTTHYMAHTSDAATDIHTSHDIVMHSTHLGNQRKKAGISCPCLLLCTYDVEYLVC